MLTSRLAHGPTDGATAPARTHIPDEWLRRRIPAVLLCSLRHDRRLPLLLENAGIHTLDTTPFAARALARCRSVGAALVVIPCGRHVDEARRPSVAELLLSPSETPLLFLGTPSAAHLRMIVGARKADVVSNASSTLEIAVRARRLLALGAKAANRLERRQLSLDWRTRTVRRGARVITLSWNEMVLVDRFLATPGRPVRTGELLDRVLAEGSRCHASNNFLAVYVRGLREKLRPWASVARIRTVRGVGYALDTHDFVRGSAKS